MYAADILGSRICHANVRSLHFRPFARQICTVELVGPTIARKRRRELIVSVSEHSTALPRHRVRRQWRRRL